MNSGSYQIYFFLPKEIQITVGKLGIFLFPAGNYVYTGSAMKNLRQRVARHITPKKKIKWHIDYLLSIESVEIQKVEMFISEKKEECERNKDLENHLKCRVIVPHFGSSDCKVCPSHLFFIEA